jgi:hypothetical protein
MDVESRKKIKEQKFVNLRYNRIRNTTAFLSVILRSDP